MAMGNKIKTFKIEPGAGEIFFTIENDPNPIMVISKGKFIWKGKEVKDIHKIYERFNEWLTEAEVTYEDE
jgi:hypothetical protein